jgi:(2Fe-2S) ferredoxin
MPTVKNKMQALLRRGTAFLTPSPSSSNIKDANGFSTAKTETVLFPQTDPAVDGEECLHDCSSCTVHYPAKFSIDEDDKLYGHVKGWDTHLIVGTGKNDWVRDVTDEKGTVMEAVGKFGQEIQLSNGRGKGKVMLSASNMPTGGEHGDYDNEEGADCLLLPSWIMIEKVQPPQVPALMRQIISTSASNKSPLSATKSEPQSPVLTAHRAPSKPQLNGKFEPQSAPTSDTTADEPDISALTLTHSPSRTLPAPTPFKTKPIPHSALILMCSHRTRDARCGQSAPLLRKEFERHLRPLGLYRDLHDDRPGGVGIYFINHVGGHKYSANVMIYRRAGSIRPETQSDPGIQNGPVVDDEAGIGKNGDGVCERQKLSSEAVQGIWLARVTPEDCENIVRYTVLQGKLVKPQRQLRGGFDRERGLVSW